MPSCAFKKCENHDKIVNKRQGISFHRFPSNEVRAQEWVALVRKQRGEPRWMPAKNNRICSIHFKSTDKYTSDKGFALLKNTAVPVIELPDSSGLDQPSCSSFADASDTFSEPLPMEEQSEPEPVTMLEIKQEVLWDGEQNCSKEVEPARGYQSIPASEQMEEEDAVRAALEQMRGEISALARGDELSAGLEQIRGEIRDLARGDEFDAFGRYVASLLRNMRPRRAQQAQPLIINLLAAEMIKKDDDET